MTAKEQSLFLDLLDQRAQALMVEINALEVSGRTDEANLKKVTRSIYASVGDAVRKNPDDRTFLNQLETFRTTWQGSRNAASTQRDWDRMAVEEAKMGALRDVQTMYDGAKQEAD